MGLEKKFWFNDEGIRIVHQPAAHTDGDSMVWFNRSDVVSTGDIFASDRYPVIDLKRGGGIQGVIDGLNHLIEMAIPGQFVNGGSEDEGGTMLIPGHGRLCDSADLVFYQEMVTIIRDRIQDLIKKGMSLEQVKAAKPTMDYDPVYGSETGPWTTDMFVEAMYRSLAEKPQGVH
jgi:glyoxylase-like metal-dependent hydrolase (beta-lactamase superfamily II)